MSVKTIIFYFLGCESDVHTYKSSLLSNVEAFISHDITGL